MKFTLKNRNVIGSFGGILGLFHECRGEGYVLIRSKDVVHAVRMKKNSF